MKGTSTYMGTFPFLFALVFTMRGEEVKFKRLERESSSTARATRDIWNPARDLRDPRVSMAIGTYSLQKKRNVIVARFASRAVRGKHAGVRRGQR